MEADTCQFSVWLGNRLKELGIDESVFCPYVISILEDEDDEEEIVKAEALDDILQGLGGNINYISLRDEILKKWSDYLSNPSVKYPESNTSTHTPNGLGDQLDQILKIASENAESTSTKKNANTDVKLRECILSQVQASDSDEDVAGGKPSTSAGGKKKTQNPDACLDSTFGRNANAEKVLNEEKEMKEKARAESLKKKEKDKEDRAKQKAQLQEKKDKAKKKAAKVERKR